MKNSSFSAPARYVRLHYWIFNCSMWTILRFLGSLMLWIVTILCSLITTNGPSYPTTSLLLFDANLRYTTVPIFIASITSLASKFSRANLLHFSLYILLQAFPIFSQVLLSCRGLYWTKLHLPPCHRYLLVTYGARRRTRIARTPSLLEF